MKETGRVRSQGNNAISTSTGRILEIDDFIGYNVQLWDQLAHSLDSTFPIDALRLKECLVGCVRVLDYGCGTGRVLAVVDGIGIPYIAGCDTSERACMLAKKRVPRAQVVWISDPRKGPDIAPGFDAILIVGVLSSVIPLTERRKLLKIASNLVRHNGLVVVADFGVSESAPYPDRYKSCVIEDTTFVTSDDLLTHHFYLSELIDLVGEVAVVKDAHSVEAVSMHGNRLPAHVVYGTVTKTC